MSLGAPQLEHFCGIEATVSPIMDGDQMIGLGRTGRRRIVPITGGRLLGPQIQGRVLPGGADFQWVIESFFIGSALRAPDFVQLGFYRVLEFAGVGAITCTVGAVRCVPNN